MKFFTLKSPRRRFVLALFCSTAIASVALVGQTLGGFDPSALTLQGQIVRGAAAGNYPEMSRVPINANNRGDQIVVQGLPALTEVVRMGNSYQAITGTAAAALTAIPTTVALVTVWNGEPAMGRSYVIDSVFWTKIIVDTTQVEAGPTMFCMNNTANPIAAITGSLTPVSLSGRRNYAGLGLVGVGQTVTNNTWFPCGTTSAGIVPAIAGSGWQAADYDLRGMYIVPPAGAFSIGLAEITATASKFQLGMRWHEVQLLRGI